MVTLTVVWLLEFHVVPKVDHKQCRYLPTNAFNMPNVLSQSVKTILSGYIICVIQILTQVTIFASFVVTSYEFCFIKPITAAFTPSTFNM